MSFPFYKQLDQMDCGPTCLKIISKFHGRNFNIERLRQYCNFSRQGVSLLGISDGAEKLGMRTLALSLSIVELSNVQLPCILHWRQEHFIVLYKIKNNKYYISDPAEGLLVLSKNDVLKYWVNDQLKGFALLISVTPNFFEQDSDHDNRIDWTYIFRYLSSYKQLFIQLSLGLLIGSLLQLIAPFLTQSIIDIGINTRDVNFIYIIIFAQAALIVGKLVVDFTRSWILLHISTRVNISLLTDFLIKLMKLPISYFDSKMSGDIMQRINDQKKIETFLTGSALSTLFSLINLCLLSFVLAHYNTSIFFIFIISSTIYMLWIILFLKSRRVLNYRSFDVSTKNQDLVIQLISGMQEIKLNNNEKQRRWEWEYIQAKIFRYSIKTLSLNQYQQGGGTLINEGKNLLITYVSATAVIRGNLTLGEMIAIQFIVGQLGNPIDQMLGFIQGLQDAQISLERLNEIHKLDNEEKHDFQYDVNLPPDKSILINKLSFRYPGAGMNMVLKNISLNIPQAKTTAIVGTSGSGKTTLLKILMRFYKPEQGDMLIGRVPLDNFSFQMWRSQCGVVMQDGFIFSDTIEKNISIGDESTNQNKLHQALQVANIQDFVESLPLGLKTKVGAAGVGLSQGQKQRVLIARAVYKDPQYIFFDEATNALDAYNEKIIMDNLKEFFIGRTVIVVAHRLSTVKNADNIIVLHNGEVSEQGNHEELISLQGRYYNLVRNQLELNN